MSRVNFYKENNELLNTILKKRFFDPWHENYKFNFAIDEKSLAKDAHLEIFITPTCNQKCEYCYLIKNPDLYPQEINNKDIILKNLEILLNWCIDNEYAIPTMDIFTGEIWHTYFGEQILEIILNAIKRGFKVKDIVIPSNCSFIRKKESLEKIQFFINSYKNYGTNIAFSISVDGKIIEDYSRPTNDSSDIKDDNFYELLFSFARYNNFLFHPMVSPSNVKNWIENFQWWEDMITEFNGVVDSDVMMLEVRDGQWDDEAINHYKLFLSFLIDRKIKEFKNIEDFSRALFCIDTHKDFNAYDGNMTGYIPYCFPEANTFAGCTVSSYLTIRLGDLAICPCHRTSYEKYLYGKFVVENNKIIGLNAINPQIAIKILLGNQKFNLKCSNCVFKDYCLKGCYGAQIETNKDPFVPIFSICNFFKEKYIFLLKKYKEIGVIDYLTTVSPYSPVYPKVQNFLNFYKEVEKQYGMD